MLIKLFCTAFLQVFFVSGNTLFISRLNWWGIGINGFMISFLWTFNVTGIIRNGKASSMVRRIVYSLGAMFGGITGVLFASITDKIMQG